jgi:hypothetical protein
VVLLTYVINPVYLSHHALYDAAMRFAKERSIQLQQFLIPDVAKKLTAQLASAPLKEHYVPDQCRCHEPKKIPALAKQLWRVLETTHEMRKIISTIVQEKVRFRDACLCVYEHGDYTVRHDKNREPPGYDVIIDLTPRWDSRACGHHSYVDSGGNERVKVPPMFNALSIVHRPAKLQKFVKYVNHCAGDDRRIVFEARYA